MKPFPAWNLDRCVQLLSFATLLTLLYWTSAPACDAQAPSVAPAPAKAVALAPATEIVRLVNGAEFKGQIAERVPDSHVVIVTLAGEAKRFAWTEVAFAGAIEPVVPAAAAPVEAAAPPAALPAPVTTPVADGPRLELQTNHQGLMWHARNLEERSERMLCISPCTANLAPGQYSLGLSSGSRDTIWEPAVWKIKDDGAWSGNYESHRGGRIAGSVILGVGLAGSLGLIISGARANGRIEDACSTSSALDDACDDANLDRPGKARIIVGAIGAVVSAIVGVALMSRKDKVSIRAHGSANGTEPPPEPQAALAEDHEYEATVWTCVDDESRKFLSLVLEVDASGVIRSVPDVENVGWGTRTCIRNNLPGRRAGGKEGRRGVVIIR